MTSSSLAALKATREELPPFDLDSFEVLPPVEELLTCGALLLGAQQYLLRADEFRELQRAIPVLVLGPPEQLSQALALGCSDYLRDPWSPDELFARFRRRAQRIDCTISGELLTLTGDRLEGEAGEVTLEPGEARVLRALMLASGDAVDRGFLALLLGLSPTVTQGSRALDARVSRLRRKAKPLLSKTLRERAIIRAVYGGGYRLECG